MTIGAYQDRISRIESGTTSQRAAIITSSRLNLPDQISYALNISSLVATDQFEISSSSLVDMIRYS
ncbi:MAG TPA: hypothetical protein VF503_07385 [Sphingobium sp.]